jgi:hypothetical protein
MDIVCVPAPVSHRPIASVVSLLAYRAHQRFVMDCPICLAKGENITPVTYKGLVVSCPSCGAFRITKNALSAFPNLRVEKRLEALDKAKMYTSPRAWPTISNACF